MTRQTCFHNRLEVLAALTPKKFWRGEWRPGPRNIRFRYHVRSWCGDDDGDDDDGDDDGDDDDDDDDDGDDDDDDDEHVCLDP